MAVDLCVWDKYITVMMHLNVTGHCCMETVCVQVATVIAMRHQSDAASLATHYDRTVLGNLKHTDMGKSELTIGQMLCNLLQQFGYLRPSGHC